MFYFGLASFVLAFLLFLLALSVTIVHLFQRKVKISTQVRLISNLSFVFHTVSILTLLYMQIAQDYSNAYVVAVINPPMPTYLKMTALWGGRVGSLFFWSWIINFCLILGLNRRHILQNNWALLFAQINLIFFSAISLFVENPFRRVWELAEGNLTESLFIPEAGAKLFSSLIGFGLNPLLRHWGMVIHPPVLYIGFAAFLLPFAETLSHLILKGNGENLIEHLRPWLLLAWIFLTAGIVLGSWWSYDVLGWGGYWAWDPVETASLLPWLLGTALLHSMFLQQKRNIFRRINLILVLFSYLFIVFSIFITRAGLFNSVHAFGESAISQPMMLFLFSLTAVSIALLIWRWKKLDSGWEFHSFFSRDALFLYTLVLLSAITLVCLWGLVYPLATRTITGNEITLDRGFYDRAVTPLFILLVFLMSFCPLVGWSVSSLKKLGKRALVPVTFAMFGTIASAIWLTQSWLALLTLFIVLLGLAVLIVQTWHELMPAQNLLRVFWKMRSRYGAYLVHAGILLIALGIVGVEGLSQSIQGVMIPGDKMPLGEYAFELIEIDETFTNPEYLSVRANLNLWRGDKIIARIHPGQDLYETRNQYVSVPGKRSTVAGDIYTLLLDYDTSMGFATVQATINPLVNYMWIGSLFLCMGGALSLSSSIVLEAMRRDADGRDTEESSETDQRAEDAD